MLCLIPQDSTYHNIKCLERVYESCGVDNLQLLREKLSDEGIILWFRYMYLQENCLEWPGEKEDMSS